MNFRTHSILYFATASAFIALETIGASVDRHSRKITDHSLADLVIPEIYPGAWKPLPQPDHNRPGILLDGRYYPAADSIP